MTADRVSDALNEWTIRAERDRIVCESRLTRTVDGKMHGHIVVLDRLAVALGRYSDTAPRTPSARAAWAAARLWSLENGDPDAIRRAIG